VIGHHHDLFSAWAKDVHDLVDVLAEFQGIKMGHDFIEDAAGTILHGANDVEQDPARDVAPGAIGLSGLAFESFLAFDLAWIQGTYGQAIGLGPSPPAAPGQGKAPSHGLILVEQDDLVATCPLFEGGQVETGQGEFIGVGLEPAGGTAVAQRVFFNTSRILSRPSWVPVCWASTVASWWQLHWEWTQPCFKGS
jgi:hypothetical protein